jgi:hypothetical protein
MCRTHRFTGLTALVLAAVLALPAPSNAYNMLRDSSSGWTVNPSSVACTNLNGFMHWDTDTIPWYLNTSGQGAGKDGAVQAALTTWNNAGTEYSLTYAGTYGGGYQQNDGHNTISWGIDGVCDSKSCHAITGLLLQAPTTTPNGQVILESDILFNANPNRNFQWMTNGQYSPSCWQTPNSNGLMIDTQGIATHELGHSLGIGHPATQDTSSSAPTMGLIACTTDGRSLASDDISALTCSENRYPQNPLYDGFFSTATCRSISGTALNLNREGQISYVEVVEAMSNGTTRLINIRPAPAFQNRFSYIPGSASPNDQLLDGNWHSIKVRHTGTAEELFGGPKSIICGVPLFSGQPGSGDRLSTGGVPYEVATQFSSTHGGYISHLGYYFPGTPETGARTARLWTDTGTLLGSVSLTPSPFFQGIGWVYQALPTRIQIQPNVRYRVSITTYNQQTKTPCGLGSWLTNGPLTAHQGFWGAGDGTASPFMPTNSSCSNFWVGVKFET